MVLNCGATNFDLSHTFSIETMLHLHFIVPFFVMMIKWMFWCRLGQRVHELEEAFDRKNQEYMTLQRSLKNGSEVSHNSKQFDVNLICSKQ